MSASPSRSRKFFPQAGKRRSNKGSSPIRCVRLALEQLEGRDCPSTFYDFNIIAQTNGSITSILPAASINESGNVAFVAATSTGQSVYVGNGTSAPQIISFANPSSTVTYGQELQINNSGQVAAVDLTPSGSQRLARIWDSNSPGTFTVVARSSSPLINSSHFDSLQTFASMTNDRQLAFAGLESDEPLPPSASSWEIHLANGVPMVDSRDFINDLPTGAQSEVATIPSAPAFFRLMAADGDRVIVGSRESATGPKSIVLYDSTGFNTSDTIASTSSGLWSDLGVRPGISDDGQIVAFYGNLTAAGATAYNTTSGPGIFVSVQAASGWKILRIAGVTGNGQLDPGETFVDQNGNGKFDPGETDQGPFTSFEPDTRPGVTNRPDNLDAVTVAYLAHDSTSQGTKGLYTSQLTFIPTNAYMPHSEEDFTIGKPSTVLTVGQSVANLGAVQDIAIHDSINNNGQLAVWVNTGVGTAILQANPHRAPVLFLPGIGGNWYNPQTTTYIHWLMNRGVAPDDLMIDPMLHSYDDLIQSLKNAGYTLYDPSHPSQFADLFIANYDWRLDVAPKPSGGVYDGVISGVSGASISDNTFEYGLDYFGYYLKKAADAWQQRYGHPLESVDVIAHSTGGLITRSYIQSPAYGDGLPKIDNFIMAAVPNRGASKAWNPLHDNFIADSAFKFVLSKMVAGAYNKVVQGGQVINGPTPSGLADLPLTPDPLTGQLRPDPITFINLYVPTIRSLLATYDFLDLGNGIHTNVNSNLSEANSIALDLNNGLDKAPNGDVRRFAQYVRTVAIFGVGEDTISYVLAKHGPPPDSSGVIAPMNGGLSSRPAGIDEDWYQDLPLTGTLGGDGTVPLDSLNYAVDDRIKVYRFDRPSILYQGVGHTQILANAVAQRQILNLLGARIDDADISTNLAVGDLAAAVNSLPAVWNFKIDPVQAYLTDANGKRLGYTSSTGILEEIPGGVYFGDTDGIGWITEAVQGPLQLHLIGVGQNYSIRIEGTQGFGAVVYEKQGFLAAGETEVITLPMPPDTNQSPTATNDGPLNTFLNTQVAISVLANDTDTDGALAPSTVAIGTGPAHGSVSVNTTTGVITYTPNAGFLGTDTFTYTVKDNQGALSNIATVTVQVLEPNQLPVLNPIGNRGINEGNLLTFTVSATDPNSGDVLALSASTLPSGATFNPNTGVFSWTPTEAQGPGTYVVTFTVSDGQATDSEMVTITVGESNQLPVWTPIGNRNVAVGALLEFTVAASDGDLPGQSLVYSALNLPGGATFDPETRRFRWTPTPNQAGLSRQVTFRVSDGVGFSEQTITVSVASNPPRVLNMIVGDGTAQRSRIARLQVNFSTQVRIQAGAFGLFHYLLGYIPVSMQTFLYGGKTVALLSFVSPYLQAGSLPDGSYQLVTRGARIRDLQGNLLDGDRDGTSGGNRVDHFLRLFGDSNGNGRLDATDRALFQWALQRRSNYLWYLDFNGDGRLDKHDQTQFTYRGG